VCRVGGDEDIQVDVRLIVAAKDNLLELTESGKFLPDLYYRISEALTVEVKPLRERPDDILPLIKLFQNEFGTSKDIEKRFTSDAIETMHGYKWPGNVRELRSVVKKLYLKVDSKIINTPDIERELLGKGRVENDEQAIIQWSDLETKHKNEKIKYILTALHKSDDHRTKAAELLGLKRSSLNTLMRAHGLINLRKEKKLNLMKVLFGKS